MKTMPFYFHFFMARRVYMQDEISAKWMGLKKEVVVGLDGQSVTFLG